MMKAQALRSMVGFCFGVGWGILSLNANLGDPAPQFELSRWQSEESVKLNDYQGSVAGFINIISQNYFKADGTPQPPLTISATFTNTQDTPISVTTEPPNV